MDANLGRFLRWRTAGIVRRAQNRAGRYHWRMDQLHITARSPRSAGSAHRVHVPTHPPVRCVLECDKRATHSKPVLRRHAACRNVQRVVSKQRVRTTRRELQPKSVTCLSDVFPLASKVRLQVAFLAYRRHSDKAQHKRAAATHPPSTANPSTFFERASHCQPFPYLCSYVCVLAVSPPPQRSQACALGCASIAQRLRVPCVSLRLRRECSLQLRDRKSTRLNSSHVEISYAV